MNLSFIRNRHFFLLDALALSVTPLLALVLRTEKGSNLSCYFQGGDDPCYFAGLLTYTTIALLIRLACFYFLGLYRRYWRYASVDDMVQIGFAVFLSSGVITAITYTGLALDRPAFIIPRSIPLIDALLVFVYLGGSRFALRFAVRWHRNRPRPDALRVAVMGAGDAGAMIVRELQQGRQGNMQPVCFLDDDLGKHDVRIHGIPVLGGRQDIPRLVQDYGLDQVIIAMPTASGKTIRDIVQICESAQVDTKIVPGLYELLDGTVSLNQLRDVDIEDLLRREPVRTNVTAVRSLLHGRRVLVTGGGGSIGSELCRQIMAAGPEQLVLLGHGENAIFDIYNELLLYGRKEGRQTEVQPVIADVRFPRRLRTIFAQVRPEIIFHAAAHKHVPLMELNAAEAISNNVLGTQNVLRAALEHGVERFVMISTDKAVNPTSIMGASKRVAELLVHAAAKESGRPYVAVRFGNVLGSRGSVVFTFKQQIAAGGPLTVTHPEMRRYFMTIPEAVQLVLQAAVMGQGGELFMLDMGEPVKIVDLARDLIELSGLELGQDIDIEFVGLRPGEKLFEEMFVSGEQYQRTHHHKIFIAADSGNAAPAELDTPVGALIAAAERQDDAAIRRLLRTLVPEYEPLPPPAAAGAPAQPAGNPASRPAGGSRTASQPTS